MHDQPVNVHQRGTLAAQQFQSRYFPRMTRTHNWKAADEIFITCSSVMLTYFGEVVRWPSVCLFAPDWSADNYGKSGKSCLLPLGLSILSDLSGFHIRRMCRFVLFNQRGSFLFLSA